jgi:hypothetical protein
MASTPWSSRLRVAAFTFRSNDVAVGRLPSIAMKANGSRGPATRLHEVIQFHHVPHALLRRFPNCAHVAAHVVYSSGRWINTDLIAKAVC